MKNIILTIAFLSINFVFGQIIFNNYYESNNTKGINLFENDNKYILMNSDSGLVSVDKNNGNNSTNEFVANSLTNHNSSKIKYDVLSKEDQGFFIGIRELYQDSIFQNSWGSYWTRSDGIIIKMDANFNIIWNYRLSNDTSNYFIRSIKGTTDGGCIVAANVSRLYDTLGGFVTASDAILFKLSVNGNLEWRNDFNTKGYYIETFGGNMEYGIESFTEVSVSNDNNIIAIGKKDNLMCSVASLWVSSYNLSGTLLWETFKDPEIQSNGQIKYEIYPSDLLIEQDKIIVVGAKEFGYTDPNFASFLCNEESYMIEMNNTGTILRDSVYYSFGTSSIESICKKDNELFLIQYAYSQATDNDDVFINRLNANLSFDTLTTISNLYCGSSVSESIIDSQGNIVFIGRSGNQTGCNKPWLVKYGFSASRITEIADSTKKLIKIVNLLGQETEFKPNTSLIYIYDDGSTEKVFQFE
jgi:hypothetical protein